jgi:hypothetical protein
MYIHRNSFLLFCLYTLHKKVPYLPNFAKLVFRPLISSIFFHILYKTTYLSPILTFYEKIRENLTKYNHFSEYYELKNLWLRYDTNSTYYEFHICLTIRFNTTFKKTITPTLRNITPKWRHFVQTGHTGYGALQTIDNFLKGWTWPPGGDFCPLGVMFTPSFTPRGEHYLLFRRMEGRTENFTPRG